MASISSISNNTSPIQNTSHQAISNSRDKEIQGLIDQKSRLNEQIEAVKSNENMDKKLKQERVQALKTSIQEIDAQIAQIKAEEMQEKIENSKPNKTETKKPETDSAMDITAESMHVLLQNHTTYDRLGMLVGLSKKVEGEIKPLEGEVKLEEVRLSNNPTHDAGRASMLENAERTVLQAKRDRVQDIKSTVRGIDSKIGDVVSELKDNDKTAETRKELPRSLLHPEGAEKDDHDHSSASQKKTSTAEATGVSGQANDKSSGSPSIDVRV
ncbi:FlxA-like family protein [Paenibacillus sp. 22594]|uniref:FlxA-like family protein n=1 Tax=Paenibacillus sp. 22594 TaxID=3453947 RepID=UPI003F82C467